MVLQPRPKKREATVESVPPDGKASRPSFSIPCGSVQGYCDEGCWCVGAKESMRRTRYFHPVVQFVAGPTHLVLPQRGLSNVLKRDGGIIRHRRLAPAGSIQSLGCLAPPLRVKAARLAGQQWRARSSGRLAAGPAVRSAPGQEVGAQPPHHDLEHLREEQADHKRLQGQRKARKAGGLASAATPAG